MAWVRKKIKIRNDLDKLQRQVVGQQIVDHIVDRSKGGLDKTGKAFPGYSKSYIKSLDFSIAGKSKSNVNLTLSGELLDSLKVISERKGQVIIGFDKKDPELNGKAEGNIKGTYGGSAKRGKKRDFLGIQRTPLKEIQDEFDFKKGDRDKVLERLSRLSLLLSEV